MRLSLDLFGPVYASWYGIWEAATAIPGTCIRYGLQVYGKEIGKFLNTLVTGNNLLMFVNRKSKLAQDLYVATLLN